MNDPSGWQQQRCPRPSHSERELRCTSTQVNLLANRLPQVNQDFLNLARSQLDAFNQLQREGREQSRVPPPSVTEPYASRTFSRSRARTRSPSPPRVPDSYRERSSLRHSGGICTPPTPHRPSSSPDPPVEDSETLPDAPRQHSPTPSVIGWDSYVAESQPTRQTTDRYIPEYTERTQLPARHPHAPERPRQRGSFSSRSRQPHHGRQPHHRGQQRRGNYHHEAEGTAPSREDPTSGVRSRGRARGRGGGGQRTRSLHERIRF